MLVTHLSNLKLFISPRSNLSVNFLMWTPGTLLLIYWSFPWLANFWNSVFHTISQVLWQEINPDSLCAIFWYCHGPKFSKIYASRVQFSILLAKWDILLKWKDPMVPSHSKWFNDIMLFMELEKIRYTIHGSVKKF